MIRRITAVMVVALIAAGSTVQGVALSDEVVRKLQKEGTLQTWMERMNQWRAAGMDQPLPRKDHDQLALSRQTTADSTVVILVDFYDQLADPANTPAAFDSLLFSVDKNPTGSMKEFYLQNSYGQYVLGGKAFGWYQPLGVNHQSYDGYLDPDDAGDFNPAILVQWAVAAADLDVDFSQFDTDHDGVLNGVIIIHSGYGAEESGNTTDIWSHMSSSPISTNDGVTIMSYTIQPEKSFSSRTMSAIGVFCHEWGHVMSLPDLYDTDGSCEGVGNWSLMGAGNYNGGSKRPAHLDAWSKYWLGWLELTNITANTTGIEVPAIEFNPVAYRLAKGGTLGTYEYFIVENREKIGFDDNLPGEGLLIYHIDYQAQGNWNDWHPKVFIEQADGKFDLQYGRNRGDGSDAYPIAGAARTFNDKTIPDSRLYSDAASQVAVWNIPDPDSVMTVDFDVFFSRPLLTLNSTSFNDQTYGDGDGTLDPEEKIQVSVSLSNEWAAANNISVTLSTDDPHLTVTVPTVSFGSLATGESSNNTSLPFEFEIPTVINPRIDSFYFHVTANEGAFDTTLGVEYSIGNAKVLVVDDDNSDPNNLENYLVAPMYKLRAPVDIWNKAVQGSPDSAALAKYHAVLWLTGDYRDNILTAEDVVAMATFMDGGGNLFLTGQGIAKQLSTFDPGFMADYLKSEYIGTKYVPVLKSDPSATVLNSTKYMVIQGASGAHNQTAPDQITAVNGGMPELYFLNTADQTSTALKAAVLYSGTYKMAFFSFGFEAIMAGDA
ncbi:MAG: M6 family metalloprotease domain-containing protein, partial [candidate division Zixibacteria bacterium]|nr:M6 family metalloprotease domain-containing protein [candidate division Zixibacteria bacterium]